LMVLRSNDTLSPSVNSGIKVLVGKVIVINTQGGSSRMQTLAPEKKTVAETTITAPGTSVVAIETGAVILYIQELDNRPGPYRAMTDVKTDNMFPKLPEVSEDVRGMTFPFIKVDKLDWGAESGEFVDFEFYNMTGFYLHFNDKAMEQICHMQAWTLGMGETARFHNHDMKSFCEIHYCLYNGGGKGGMRYFKDEDDMDLDKKKETDDLAWVEAKSHLLVVPPLHEHGALWKVEPGTQSRPRFRANGTVDYPYHAWLASDFPNRQRNNPSKQAFDIWLAFEFPDSAFPN